MKKLPGGFDLWDLIGRTPADIPAGRTLHVIEHQVWRSLSESYCLPGGVRLDLQPVQACCSGAWTVKLSDGPPITLSRIVTGPGSRAASGPGWLRVGDVSIHLGLDAPVIRQHCIARAKRISEGKCFTLGPLGSHGPRISRGSDYRYTRDQLSVVNEIHFALAADPRNRRIEIPGQTPDESPRTAFQSQPGTPPLFSNYLSAHLSKRQTTRRRLLETVLEELWDLCPSLPKTPGPAKKLHREFLDTLMARVSTGEERSKRRYRTAKDLAYALGSEMLSVDPKTLRRRVFLHSPYEASFA